MEYYKLGGQGKYWSETDEKNKKKLDKITIVGSQNGNLIRVCGNNCLIDFS
jgi:hypothetical protein